MRSPQRFQKILGFPLWAVSFNGAPFVVIVNTRRFYNALLYGYCYCFIWRVALRSTIEFYKQIWQFKFDQCKFKSGVERNVEMV